MLSIDFGSVIERQKDGETVPCGENTISVRNVYWELEYVGKIIMTAHSCDEFDVISEAFFRGYALDQVNVGDVNVSLLFSSGATLSVSVQNVFNSDMDLLEFKVNGLGVLIMNEGEYTIEFN